jgi:hypothetical protein
MFNNIFVILSVLIEILVTIFWLELTDYQNRSLWYTRFILLIFGLGVFVTAKIPEICTLLK